MEAYPSKLQDVIIYVGPPFAILRNGGPLIEEKIHGVIDVPERVVEVFYDQVGCEVIIA